MSIEMAFFVITDTFGRDHFCNEVELSQSILDLQGYIASVERVYKRLR